MTSADLVFPFGKYKDFQLGTIPSSYLQWTLETCDNWHPGLLQDIQDELDRRKHARKHASLPANLMTTWAKRMSKRFMDQPSAEAIIREAPSSCNASSK